MLRACLLTALPLASLLAAPPDPNAETVKTFLATYCIACHSGANAAAQFDLKPFASEADVIRDHGRWALAAEKLTHREMPPKGMKQPSDAERQSTVAWIEGIRTAEARRNAGDPGHVLVRRLSNAEYNYAIRDLTGADIRPTREFPTDPTNQDGFDNTGESLVMSPALLNKYLQAAREVSSHMMLQPASFRFAPHPMLAESDREKYTIQRIVDFYGRQPTDYADYFFAAWSYRHRAALGKPDARIEDFAREAKISARYLPLVWSILEEAKEDAGPVAKLQTMWKRLPDPSHKQTDLVKEGCRKMRDYVVHVRRLTARNFRSPKVAGLSGTSQPLMNWKLRAYAAHRRDFDREALQVEGEPPMLLPESPRMGGVPTEDQVGLRNAAIAVRLRFGDPELLVPAGQRARYEASFARFANVFPDAFYVRERGRFYPDDSEDKGRLLSAGFHNVMGYFRDDTPLMELILDEGQREELETLWLEFDTVADQTTRTYVQFYYNQSGEIEGRGRESGSFRTAEATDATAEKVIFGIRDTYLLKAAETSADEAAREAIREHFARVNAQIRKTEKARVDAERTHLASLEQFAARAWRRALSDAEKTALRAYYATLREKSKLSHEDAMRDMIVYVLMFPDFLYRVDYSPPAAPVISAAPRKKPRTAARVVPVNAPKHIALPAQALASRLSFLLWSSVPDEELLARAAAGDLQNPEVLIAQVRRMMKDPRAQALAVEFAGNWLGFRRIEELNSVDRARFPAFTNDLRAAMFEEPVRFLEDLIRSDQSMLEALYGRHTFVNRALARHYGMENLRFRQPGDWVRVNDARRYGRGGLLPMAAFLTKNSPGLRTSPVKRGYWVARTVLGEVIPPPPPSVPELPSDEAKMDLPLRQMLARHRDNAACAGCHRRFDGFGLAFEGYGPVGERRGKDLAGRTVDAKAEFPGGGEGSGIEGLLEHIKAKREEDFINNLCRKTLAYGLSRSLLLSDEPLLAQMRAAFTANGNRFSALIESMVASPQFLNRRNPEHKGD
ncbi:MAG: DUF1592 domain-containing protein [Acidobacteria bacterium]|nr:DUF1592 domain-containing protein [Acidobacteriota bacterium]